MVLSRRQVRYVAAAASATMAIIYALIGLRVLDIGGGTTPDQVDVGLFGAAAGGAFLFLSLLLVLTDRRWLWIPALIFQVYVYAIYIGTSGIRVPPYEIWGIAIHVIQIPLLVALVYLSVRAPSSKRPPVQRDDPRHHPTSAIGSVRP